MIYTTACINYFFYYLVTFTRLNGLIIGNKFISYVNWGIFIFKWIVTQLSIRIPAKCKYLILISNGHCMLLSTRNYYYLLSLKKISNINWLKRALGTSISQSSITIASEGINFLISQNHCMIISSTYLLNLLVLELIR